MSQPVWLAIARTDIGLREIPGKATAPKIAMWLKQLGAWWADDATPWCGVAVAAWMRDAGVPLPKHWYRARAWLEWGTALTKPVRGCVVVFERSGGGHVGLVDGQDQMRRLLVIGGNQGDAVSVAAFDTARVLGYRWPVGVPLPSTPLPIFAGGVPVSTNEA